MAANTSQIFSKVADIQFGVVLTANTAMDGTGTVVTIFTADATNGGRVEAVRWRAAGTNVVTVGRLFINNGSTNATASNNTLYAEITLPATTSSAVAALADQLMASPFFPISLPPGYKLNVTVGTTVASGYAVTAVGGKY